MHTHADGIAAFVCGILMGIVFVMRVTSFQAELVMPPPEAPVQEITSSVSVSSVESSISESEASVEAVSSSESSEPAQVRTVVVPKLKKLQPIVPHPAATQEEPRREPVVRSSDRSPDSSAENVASSEASVSSEAPSSAVPPQETFPAFKHSSFPVSRVPNWGEMRTPQEWNRTYNELGESDFTAIPAYNISALTTPLATLTTPLRVENFPLITAKLFYSTRFFGSYDVDSGEWTGTHAGIDLKLARGTPVGAIGGGRVSGVSTDQLLGLHVIIEHRLVGGETYYSIYGHLDRAAVSAGQTVIPGTTVGVVGMTGNTTAPHLHLQIDRGQPGEANHVPYLPTSTPSQTEAATHVVNPILFIGAHRHDQ